MWIVAVIALIALVVIIVAVNSDDDDEAVSTTTSEPESTTTSEPGSTTTSTTSESSTTSAPESTTTTAANATTTISTPAGPSPLPVEASEIVGEVERYDETDADMPFEDGEVQTHWYQWDDHYVVVFAGWDASTGEAQCPGNSIALDSGFEHVSNSPTAEGGCDPLGSYPEVIPAEDYDGEALVGARVCDGLVLYQTIIPVTDDNGEALDGDLYGTVERIVDGEFVGATGQARTNPDLLTELDPNADAYTVPRGWLPDGRTELAC